MKVFKVLVGLVLFGALITVVQLYDPAPDSPTAQFQQLPDVNLPAVAEAEAAAGRTEAALLMLEYVIENDLPDKPAAAELHHKLVLQLAADSSPVSRLKITGLANLAAGGNSFDSLAGSTVADAVLYGEIAELNRRGAFDSSPDELNAIRPMTAVFPPADGTITLVKAALRAGAINDSLARQLRQMLALMQPEPKAALAVEKFKDNFMPMFELARRCRTWDEFQTILRQADSPDQVKVLTKMVSAAPDAAKRLSQILVIAASAGQPSASACIDYIMRQGPKAIDGLYAAIGKGRTGLKFAIAHPGLSPQSLRKAGETRKSVLVSMQNHYQSLRFRYGPGIAVLKYVLIAVLAGLLVLLAVPGRYLEKLIAKPGKAIHFAGPGPIHYFLSALLVGAVLSVLTYLLSLAVRPATDPGMLGTALTEVGAATPGGKADSALLSGTVVLLSLAIHAVVWFFVRGKIRTVEDEETMAPVVRLKQLDNLDVFLDLPLFTGLALTVIAFILITLDAGMSRHFAYTSTVVGILSSVSLRIRYVYPLKERLIQAR